MPNTDTQPPLAVEQWAVILGGVVSHVFTSPADAEAKAATVREILTRAERQGTPRVRVARLVEATAPLPPRRVPVVRALDGSVPLNGVPLNRVAVCRGSTGRMVKVFIGGEYQMLIQELYARAAVAALNDAGPDGCEEVSE